MTKEQIMIDGVDVSGCKYLYDDDYLCKLGKEDYVCGQFCKGCDCYYKQLKKEKIAYKNLLEIHNEDNTESNKEREELFTELKRKEEENDQLKAEKETLEKDLAGFDAILETFKAQYKELKAEKINIENDFAVEIQARLFHLHKHLEYLELSNLYEQALQEIKEMCKLAPKQTTCDRCHTFGSPPEHELIKLIIKKCEVIDD